MGAIRLERGEFVADWVQPVAAYDLTVEPFTECPQCIHQPFRVVVIESAAGHRRGISVCTAHFEAAAILSNFP